MEQVKQENQPPNDFSCHFIYTLI